jgi:hypothetical protein
MEPKQIIAATAAASIGILAVSSLLSKEGPVMSGRARRLAEALFRNAGGRPGHPSGAAMHMPKVAPPELREVGATDSSGERQYMKRRLYMQLRVLDVDLKAIADLGKFFEELKNLLSSVPCVLYRDANANNSIGVLTWSEDPSFFAIDLNRILSDERIASKFSERSGWTMFGKTYSNGHEKDLEEYLFRKPIRTSTKDEWNWAIWYPLRRRGPFYVQPPADQCQMLLHHAAIGKAFSEVNAAHDVRLKCFGIDAQDNEYVVGIIGDDLHCLSRVVEEMRKTKHTAEYLESLGPFFVGQKMWKSPLADSR